MANGDVKSNSTGPVWDQIHSHSSKISELSAAQAATAANLDALANTVRSGFDSVNSALSRVADDIRIQQERDSRPTNWFGLISAIVAVVAIMGGGFFTLSSLQTERVAERAYENALRIQALNQQNIDAAKEHGMMNARWELTLLRLKDFENFQHQAMRDFGRLDEMSRRVEDIDNLGSRRWNELHQERD